MGSTASFASAEVHGLLELRPPSAATSDGDRGVPIQFVIDDGSAEAAFGLVEAGLARQFLWFNEFAVPGDLGTVQLEEVHVLFPGSAGVAPGAAIEVVVYQDLDRDPWTGAVLLASWSAQIQAADDSTFSVYAAPSPVRLEAGSDAYVGVISRFVTSGVTPPVTPASLDTTTSAGGSWVALWSGDPPSSPELPPDDLLIPIDEFQPSASGNWMIRAFGSPVSAEVPVAGSLGLISLAIALAAVGLLVLSRRSGLRYSQLFLLLLVCVSFPSDASARPLPFTDAQSIATDPIGADQVVTADLDGDGDFDAASIFMGGVSRKLLWHENLSGDGIDWATHGIYEGTDVIRDLWAGDVDGDGDLDLVVGFGSPAPRVDWYENVAGDGTDWAVHAVASISGGVESVRGGDLDRDGDLDLVVGGFFGGTLHWFENASGDGLSWTEDPIATGLGISVRANPTDLDQDGDLDLLVVRESDSVVSWYENTDGAGTGWQAHAIDTPSDRPVESAVGDLDGDGDLDVLLSTTSGPAWYDNANGDAMTWIAQPIASSGVRLDGIVCADLDADGDLDAIAAAGSGGLLWYENPSSGGGDWIERQITTDLDQVSSVSVTDLDGDGDLDTIASSRTSAVGGAVDGIVAWVRNEALHRSAVFDTEHYLPGGQTSGSFGDLAMGDLDGDGWLDIAAAGYKGGSRGLYWWRGLGAGQFAEPDLVAAMDYYEILALEATDLDRDGRLDLAVATRGSGMAWWRNETGDGTSWTGHEIADLVARGLSAEDIDGDGDLDLFATKADSADYFTDGEVVWLENLDGSATSWVEHQTAGERRFGPRDLEAVDLDGDGDLDAFASFFVGIYWIENLAGDGTAWAHHYIGPEGGVQASAGDVDGDGDLDVVAVNDDLVWYENTDGSGSHWSRHFVADVTYLVDGGDAYVSPDDTSTADLDQDGDLDLLVGYWYYSEVTPTGLRWFENLDGQGTAWEPRGAGEVNVKRAQLADLDGDGDLDASATAGFGSIAILENVGGQFALSVPDTDPTRAFSGGSSVLPPLTVHHRGRTPDDDLELTSLHLLFDDGATPLATEQLGALVDRLSIHLDDGDGVFQPATDFELLALSQLPLVDGVFSQVLPEGEAALRVGVGAPKTFFLALEWTDDAATQDPDQIRIRHLADLPWTAEQVDTDVPLTLERVFASPVTLVVNDPPVPMADSYDAVEDTLLQVPAPGLFWNDSDEEGDVLSSLLDTPPAHAESFLLADDGSYHYQASQHWSGTDSFTYRVSDGYETSDPVAVTIQVAAVADPPSLLALPVSSPGGGPIPLTISAALADLDGSEQLAVTISGVPAGASLSAGSDAGGGAWTLAPADLPGLTLSLPPGLGGSIELLVTATATELSNRDSESVSDILSVDVGTDLATEVSESIDPVVAGSGSGNLHYEVLIENLGPWEATGIQVRVMAFLAAGVSLDSATPSIGSFDSGIWTLGSLPSSSTATLEVSLTVGASARAATDAITLNTVIETVDQPDPTPGNESAHEKTSIVRQADLEVNLSNGVDAVVPGGTTVFVLEARNLGPSDVEGAEVDAVFPPELTCSWTCIPSAGATCSTGPSDADLTDIIDLGLGSVATYTATCDISVDAAGSLESVATIGVPDDATDPVAENDSDPDLDTVRDLDWGDAPDGTIADGWFFPVRLDDDGARHGVVEGFMLGAALDADNDGLPGLGADGDDLEPSGGPDDEDGIHLDSPWVACDDTTIDVVVSRPGRLDAWADFDHDGSWEPSAEKILDGYEVFPGREDPTQEIAVSLPCAARHGETYLRFRLSTAGNLEPTGVAPDGEVEDYVVSVESTVDLGIEVEHDSATAVPGAAFSQIVRVTNHGESPVEGAQVESDLAFGLSDGSWTCSASPGSTCSAGPMAGNLSDLASLEPSGVLTYRLTALLESTATGSLTTTANVSAPNGVTDPQPDNDHNSDTSALTPATDLAIQIDNGVETSIPGTTVGYQMTVTNHGPSAVAGATTEFIRPAELDGLQWSCVAGPGSSCTPGPVAGELIDTVAMQVGGSVVYSLHGEIDSAALGELVASAHARPAVGAFDPEDENDVDSDVDVLAPETDLELAKNDDADPWVPGTPIVYTLTVFNRGPSDALGVVVTDVLPDGLVARTTVGCEEDPLASPECTLGTIAAGTSSSFTLEVEVTPSPPAEVTNQASVEGAHPDTDPDDNQAEETTTLDAESPGVAEIATLNGTDLTDCRSVRESVATIRILFSEEMEHEPGEPGNVAEPDSYRLVATNPEHNFDTESCASGTGDDVILPIEDVSYVRDGEPGGPSVILHSPGLGLSEGLHRLVVCESVTDVAGNPLEGDSGVGSPRATTFRIDPRNLLESAHFDLFFPDECNLDPWSSTNPQQVEASPQDADESPLSGSAHGIDPVEGLDLEQCVDLESSQASAVRLAASFRIDSAPGAAHGAAVQATFYDAASCSGLSLDQRTMIQVVLGGTHGWMPLDSQLAIPPTTRSIRFRVVLDAPFGEPFDGYVDHTFLGPTSLIFQDGFESGDLSAWPAIVEGR